MWRCHMVGCQDTERGLGGGDDSVLRVVSVTEELLAGLGFDDRVFLGLVGYAC